MNPFIPPARRVKIDLRHYRVLAVLIFLLLPLRQESRAQGHATGDTLFGRSQYIEYLPGDLPLIFAAPHGGDREPDEIPDRTYGTMVTDSYTRETVLAIRRAFLEKTGHLPHIVISHLRRTKLDPNRDIEEAAQGNPYAEQAWREYHGFIDAAGDSISRHTGAGFFIDIHGHGHPKKRLELGYLISGSSLRQSDNTLNGGSYARSSSLRHLAQYTPDTFAGLLRGDYSLGTLFEQRGIPAVPGKEQPYPDAGDRFFSGGYSTRRHGSVSGGVIDGIQIEAWYEGLRDTDENRRFYAGVMVQVINAYVRHHYGWEDITRAGIPQKPQPAAIKLSIAAPNPFSASTTIRYEIQGRKSRLAAVLYDSMGRLCHRYDALPVTEGVNTFRLSGAELSPGVYFLNFRYSGYTETLKLLIIH